MDYADPLCVCGIRTSHSGNSGTRLGKGDHTDVVAFVLDLMGYGCDLAVTGGTWAEIYDALIDTAKGGQDQERRFRLMHLVEDRLR